MSPVYFSPADAQEVAAWIRASPRVRRAQVYEYLQRTLDALPKGTSLSRTPDVDREAFGPGNIVACSDSDGATAENSPVDFSATYWVNGVSNGQQSEFVSKMVDLWRKWNWQERPGNDATDKVYVSPDGYKLYVSNADNGPGGVSVSGTSPCFWAKGQEAEDNKLTDEQPRTMKQSK